MKKNYIILSSFSMYEIDRKSLYKQGSIYCSTGKIKIIGIIDEDNL